MGQLWKGVPLAVRRIYLALSSRPFGHCTHCTDSQLKDLVGSVLRTLNSVHAKPNVKTPSNDLKELRRVLRGSRSKHVSMLEDLVLPLGATPLRDLRRSCGSLAIFRTSDQWLSASGLLPWHPVPSYVRPRLCHSGGFLLELRLETCVAILVIRLL